MTSSLFSYHDQRKSGISLVGSIHRGNHFCQFYETKDDVLEIFVPFFKAGLKSNELCVWITADAPAEDEIIRAMKSAVPHFAKYLAAGQIEIVSFSRWRRQGGTSGKAIAARLDQAIAQGFDSVRFGFSNFPAKPARPTTMLYPEIDSIVQHSAIALFAYPREGFSATGLMEVVKRHNCALVRNGSTWEVIHSSDFQRTQEALKKSNRLYTSLFNNMLDGYAYCRMIFRDGQPVDFVYLAVNRSFEKLTGLTDVIGKRVTEVIPGIEVSNPELLQIYGRVAMSGQPERFEIYLPTLSKWLTISAYSPEKGYFTAVFDDITERKKAEEDLCRQNAIVKTINRIFRESFARQSTEDLALFCLTLVEELTASRLGFIGEIGADGLLHDIAMSNPGWGLCAMQDKTGHRRLPGNFVIHGLYGHVLKTGRSLLTNDPGRHPEHIGTPAGHPQVKSFLGLPLIYGGRVKGMIGLGNRDGGYRDEDLEITEALAPAIAETLMHKRAEENLKQYSKELELSNREMESFSYTVSHDLRAPLRSMDGLSQIIADDYGDRLDDVGKDYLRRIRASSQLMAELIDDILELARVTRAEIVGQNVNLSDLATKSCEAWQSAQPERRVECRIRPGVVSYGDVNLLRLVLENLMNNAFKYSSKRDNARVEFGSLEYKGERLYFVRDNGAGFNMAYVDQLFQPFHRLHNSSEFPGTGIGLATVKRIVERHGGRVWAEGEIGKGATVYFTLGLAHKP